MLLLSLLDTGPAGVHDTNVDRGQNKKTDRRTPTNQAVIWLEYARQGQPCHSRGVYVGMTSRQEGERLYSLMTGLFSG